MSPIKGTILSGGSVMETNTEELIMKAIISVSKNVKPSTPVKIQPRDFLFSESSVTIILYPSSVPGATSIYLCTLL